MSAIKKRIMVGMSGGVDSSVSALLLLQQGFSVEGLFMKNWEADDTDQHCSAEQDLADVKAVCTKLQIPLHVVNFSKNYWDNVFQDFLKEYQAGRTPNPDVLCNKEIKFKAFLDHALALGADAIATGHYAGIEESSDGIFHLIKAADHDKDQTYFLYLLNQKQLSCALFPLAKMQKKEVREIAGKAGFVNHAKKDSTGICFIGEREFKVFLKEYLLGKPGVIKNIDNDKVLGKHDGLMYYTIGQRRGLHIGGVKNTQEAAWYVVKKSMDDNVLYVAQSHDHPALFNKQLLCKDLHWIHGEDVKLPFRCKAKTRYRQMEQSCVIQLREENVQNKTFDVVFDEPQWAVTPGQSIVFYQNEECLGGAIIEAVA